MKLRPYQEEARSSIHEEFAKGVKKTLLVLPTGCGKTIVFSKVIEDRVKKGDRCLVLAHRGELLEQAADKLEKSTGLKCAVEKAEDTAVNSWFRITVGSVQTMMNDKRLEAYAKDYYDFIIVDEAHHVLSDSYQKVLDYFEDADVLGVTATPDRGDRQNLGKYFDSIAYEYTLPKAIKQGFLSPIKALTIPLDIDLTTVKQQAGDFAVNGLGTALDPYLENIAEEMVKYASDRKAVVFLPLIETSKKFTKILNSKGLNAVEVNGQSKDRDQILEDFDNDKYQVLCNSMLLTEGWDCPSVNCIVVLRPTKVRSLYSQMVGRGTRLFKGKEDLLLLDFLWHTEKHELVRPAHLITDSQDVANRMVQMSMEQDGYAMDLEEAEQQATEDVVAERERALAEQLAEQRRKKKRLVDPLQFEMSINAEDLINYVPSFGWEMQPITEKQKEALEKQGVDPEEVGNAGKASLILNRLQARRANGLATPKQIRFLEQKGFVHVGTWEKEEASNMISRISANRWKIPHGVDPESYQPKSRTPWYNKYNTESTEVRKVPWKNDNGYHLGVFDVLTGKNVTEEVTGKPGMWLPKHNPEVRERV